MRSSSASSAAAALTFKKAARELHKELKPGWKNEKHAAQWISTLETYVFPKLGGKAKSDTPGRTATLHGFRSSFRDWASEQGYARDLAERALAHTVANKVEVAYHRTDLMEQRRPTMDAWAAHVCGMAD
ncbi:MULTISPECIES: phage integrase central domain-containing protein [Paraburkholderia]|uniref:phage integrase central domain-containing protein n=1 Tax=Paraburkholderia TaxID=1822464 RepID=UPI00036565CA|nr:MULTISPECIES: hypothetical protein [Paraburkholderia]